MKVELFRDTRGRTVLSHMIMSTPVLSRIASRWEEAGLFASTWENLVGSWCIDHYKRHSRAPKKAIQSIFEDWAESSQDRESIKSVEKFLSHVSDEFSEQGKLSTPHVLDVAGTHFARVRAERLKEQIENCLETNNLKKLDSSIAGYRKVELGEGSFIDVLQDDEALQQAFSSETLEQLITFNNPSLDKFFIHMLHRDAFIALQASEKSGKSFWLGEMAYLAALQRRRVAFFAIGDLTQDEMMLRFASRATGQPNRGPWPHSLRIPKSIAKPAKDSEDRMPTVKYIKKQFDKPLDYKTTRKRFEEIGLKKIRSKKSFLRMSCHNADSINVVQIREKLKEWMGSGFVADVAIIDYADILAPLPGFWKDERDHTNASWKKLKAMAQELHCLVVTATQADAGSYERRSQTRKNFSGDKRKYSHTDGICAINTTDAEKDYGVARLAWLTARHNRYSPRHECYVAGNLAIASPAIAAVF